MKVIGAGFGRTGTTTLKVALEELGFGPCYHMTELIAHPEHRDYWLAAVRGEKVNWQELFGNYRSSYRSYQATVDWPGCTFYQQLMQEYPDAKVLLSVRDPESWYQSCRNTIYEISQTFPMTLARKLLPFLPLSRMSQVPKEIVWERTFANRFADKAHALAVFHQHIEEVKRYVPPDRLLVYDVKQGWAPLCKFLGVPVPEDKPFPRLNDTPQFQERIKKARLLSGAALGVMTGLTAVVTFAALRWVRGRRRCA